MVNGGCGPWWASVVLLSAGCLAVGCSSTSKSNDANPLASKPQSTGAKVAAALNPVTIGKNVSNSVKTSSAKMSAAMAAKNPTPERESTYSFWPFQKKPSTDFYVALARMQEQEGNFEGAMRHYNQALEKDKNNAPALVGCAHLLDRQGQKVKATEYYLRAQKAHPKDAGIANDLGLCYARQGEFDESLKYLAKAVELQPDRDLYRNNIATVLVETGRADEAVSHMAKVYGDPVAHYNVGILLNQHGKPQAAEKQFALALQKDPGLDQAREWLDRLSVESTPHAQVVSAEVETTPRDSAPLPSREARARLASRPTGAGYERISTSGGASTVADVSAGPGMPPSPEEVRQQGTFSTDIAALPTPTPSVKPLPPVSTGYVPPSRY